MTQRQHIAIAVDDLGLYPGIREATHVLLGLGRVQAISCLVDGKDWPMASQALRHIPDDQADIGLHLDLTEPGLAAGGRYSLGNLIMRSLMGALDSRWVLSEIRRQLDLFEQTIGRSPDFVDGHRHVHQLPGVREALLRELRYRYRNRLPWLRRTRVPASTPHLTALKPAVISSLGGRAMDADMQREGFAHNRHLLGVYDFRGGSTRYEQLLDGWLRLAQTGDLLMTHPALSVIPPTNDPLACARRVESSVLSSHAFTRLLARHGVSLMPMSRILRSAPDSPSLF